MGASGVHFYIVRPVLLNSGNFIFSADKLIGFHKGKKNNLYLINYFMQIPHSNIHSDSLFYKVFKYFQSKQFA